MSIKKSRLSTTLEAGLFLDWGPDGKSGRVLGALVVHVDVREQECEAAEDETPVAKGAHRLAASTAFYDDDHADGSDAHWYSAHVLPGEAQKSLSDLHTAPPSRASFPLRGGVLPEAA